MTKNKMIVPYNGNHWYADEEIYAILEKQLSFTQYQSLLSVQGHNYQQPSDNDIQEKTLEYFRKNFLENFQEMKDRYASDSKNDILKTNNMLFHYFADKNGPVVGQIIAEIGKNIKKEANELFQSTILQNFENKYIEATQNSEIYPITLPFIYNTGSNHWTSVMITVKNEKEVSLLYVDPAKNGAKENNKLFKNIQAVFKNHHITYAPWPKGMLKQSDDSSCGVASAENMTSLITKTSMSEEKKASLGIVTSYDRNNVEHNRLPYGALALRNEHIKALKGTNEDHALEYSPIVEIGNVTKIAKDLTNRIQILDNPSMVLAPKSQEIHASHISSVMEMIEDLQEILAFVNSEKGAKESKLKSLMEPSLFLQFEELLISIIETLTNIQLVDPNEKNAKIDRLYEDTQNLSTICENVKPLIEEIEENLSNELENAPLQLENKKAPLQSENKKNLSWEEKITRERLQTFEPSKAISVF